MHARQGLADDFRRLGIVDGDVVMLHASVRAVGRVAGGPDQIHLALSDALGSGTLLMYASCPEHYDEIGRGNLTAAEEAELLDRLPAFDARTNRAARDNGTLVEFVRSYPGTLASDHVARFIGRGASAAALLDAPPWDFAFGAGSPLERLLHCQGRLLLLGSDHDQVTFLHYAEHIVEIPDKRIARFKVPVLVDGQRVWREMAEVDTSDRAHPHWPDRFFARLIDTHLAATGNRGGLVGDARSYLLETRALLPFVIEVMTAVAADPAAADRLLVC